jgi:hypothetical protein
VSEEVVKKSGRVSLNLNGYRAGRSVEAEESENEIDETA